MSPCIIAFRAGLGNQCIVCISTVEQLAGVQQITAQCPVPPTRDGDHETFSTYIPKRKLAQSNPLLLPPQDLSIYILLTLSPWLPLGDHTTGVQQITIQCHPPDFAHYLYPLMTLRTKTGIKYGTLFAPRSAKLVICLNIPDIIINLYIFKSLLGQHTVCGIATSIGRN